MSVENSTNAPVKDAEVNPEQVKEDVIEQKKKEPALTPAPLPVKSPWKSISSDIPISTIQTETLESGRKKKNRNATPTISSSTKWVPMKASFVVSGPKRSGTGGKKGSNKNHGTANNAGSKKKKQQQQQQSSKRQSSRSSNSNYSSTVPKGDVKEKEEGNTLTSETTPGAANAANGDNPEHMTQDSIPSHEQTGQMYQKRRHNHNNQFQHSAHQQNAFQKKRYYNNYNNDTLRQQRYSQQHENFYDPYQGRVPRSFGSSPHLINGQLQQLPHVVPMYQQYYSMQPALIAVNSIARQIEYYFSAENLAKDKYLRSKLSKEGYAPVGLIAKFYRVVNMSFGGDASLILAALREIVNNKNARVEIATGSIPKAETVEGKQGEDYDLPLGKYFVRSKEWESLLPETFSTEVVVEETLNEGALDDFSIGPAPVSSIAPAHDEPSSNSSEEDGQSSASTLGDTMVGTQ